MGVCASLSASGRLGAQVYDVTNTESFENVKSWLQEVNRYAAENVTVMLVGNKTDLEASGTRQVSTAEGQQLADEEGIAFVETSAKADVRVADAFNDMTREVLAKTSASGQRTAVVNINRPSSSKPKKRCNI